MSPDTRKQRLRGAIKCLEDYATPWIEGEITGKLTVVLNFSEGSIIDPKFIQETSQKIGGKAKPGQLDSGPGKPS